MRCYRRRVTEADSKDGAEPGGSGPDLPERHVTFNQLAAWNLRYYRTAAGLRGEELGERLGWTKAVVSAAERSWDSKRVRQFTVDDLVAIALALGVPVIALLMPPPDAGAAIRYILDSEPGQPNLLTVMRRLVPVYEGEDTPALAAYRDRVMALGGGAYMYAEPDLIIGRARREAQDLLGKARQHTEVMTGDARARAEALERELQDRYHRAMDTLIHSREELERRVDDLRDFEAEYRSRLLAYLEAQVADLRAGAAESGAFPAVAEGRPAAGADDEAERRHQ